MMLVAAPANDTKVHESRRQWIKSKGVSTCRADFGLYFGAVVHITL